MHIPMHRTSWTHFERSRKCWLPEQDGSCNRRVLPEDAVTQELTEEGQRGGEAVSFISLELRNCLQSLPIVPSLDSRAEPQLDLWSDKSHDFPGRLTWLFNFIGLSLSLFLPHLRSRTFRRFSCFPSPSRIRDTFWLCTVSFPVTARWLLLSFRFGLRECTCSNLVRCRDSQITCGQRTNV